MLSLLTLLLVVLCAIKQQPRLKSKYKQRVVAAIEYVRTIEDFDDLVNPQTLALHCLRPEPSAFVLQTIVIEEKKSKCQIRHCYSFPLLFFFFFFFFFFFGDKCFVVGMMTKFNQGMFVKMRGKKNEPFSSIEKRTVQVVEKGVSVIPLASDTEPTRMASPATSVKEITLLQKRSRVEDKGKDKADSWLFSIFYNVGLALSKAQESFSAKELKVFSGVPSHEIVGRHLHKLV